MSVPLPEPAELFTKDQLEQHQNATENYYKKKIADMKKKTDQEIKEKDKKIKSQEKEMRSLRQQLETIHESSKQVAMESTSSSSLESVDPSGQHHSSGQSRDPSGRFSSGPSSGPSRQVPPSCMKKNEKEYLSWSKKVI